MNVSGTRYMCVTLIGLACIPLNSRLFAASEYIVKQGDTLWEIAQRHKIDYERLCKLNNKPKDWTMIKAGQKIVVSDTNGLNASTDWTVELKVAPEAETNSFTETLWRFRGNFRRVREANADYLRKMWNACESSKREDDIICCSGCERMISNGSLQHISGDKDVLLPILNALPHLRLGVLGRLDCNVSGGKWGAHSLFVIRQDKTVVPLTLILDGSADSAWECVLLRIASHQFFLGWHAAYEHYNIVTDIRRFAEEVNSSRAGERAWRAIGEEGQGRLLKNNFTPKVSIADNMATVSYYVFSSFGGLYHVVDEVNMKTGTVKPRHVKFENVVRYDCGIKY